MPATIAFYHLTLSPLEKALPMLVARARAQELRVLVRADPAALPTLDTVLWTYSSQAFLPHGSALDPDMRGTEARQPIWLTPDWTNPNGADVLFITDGAVADDATLTPYRKTADLFDGNDPEAITAARARWKEYQARGHALTYWKQVPKTDTDAGGWRQMS